MWPVSYSNSNYSNLSNTYYSNLSNTVISNSGSNKGHINTGYYGTSNQPRLDYRYINYGQGSHKGGGKPTTLSLLLFKSHNSISAGHKTTNLYAKSNQSKYCRSTNVDKNQLFQKYQSQKKAEQEFYQLQSQISHTESLLAANPHLSSFYSQWMQHAKETLKQFTNIIESPDAVTFSVSKKFHFISLGRKLVRRKKQQHNAVLFSWSS